VWEPVFPRVHECGSLCSHESTTLALSFLASCSLIGTSRASQALAKYSPTKETYSPTKEMIY